MIVEKRKLVYKLKYRKGDLVGAINELIAIIKDNYKNIEEFQSIYDHHELLISLVID